MKLLSCERKDDLLKKSSALASYLRRGLECRVFVKEFAWDQHVSQGRTWNMIGQGEETGPQSSQKMTSNEPLPWHSIELLEWTSGTLRWPRLYTLVSTYNPGRCIIEGAVELCNWTNPWGNWHLKTSVITFPADEIRETWWAHQGIYLNLLFLFIYIYSLLVCHFLACHLLVC